MDQEGIPVFTTSHSATAATRGRRLAAGLISVALATGFALAGASTAQAADTAPVATSSAQFLSGALLGTNLDNIAALNGAYAHADADDPTMTVKDPFQATVVNSVKVGNGSSIQGNLGAFL
jgi:hypothetical protein